MLPSSVPRKTQLLNTWIWDFQGMLCTVGSMLSSSIRFVFVEIFILNMSQYAPESHAILSIVHHLFIDVFLIEMKENRNTLGQ